MICCPSNRFLHPLQSGSQGTELLEHRTIVDMIAMGGTWAWRKGGGLAEICFEDEMLGRGGCLPRHSPKIPCDSQTFSFVSSLQALKAKTLKL